MCHQGSPPCSPCRYYLLTCFSALNTCLKHTHSYSLYLSISPTGHYASESPPRAIRPPPTRSSCRPSICTTPLRSPQWPLEGWTSAEGCKKAPSPRGSLAWSIRTDMLRRSPSQPRAQYLPEGEMFILMLGSRPLLPPAASPTPRRSLPIRITPG